MYAVTQSKNFDRSSLVGRSKIKACNEVTRQLLSPSNTKRFSKHLSCEITILNNVGSIFFLLDVYEHNKTILSSQFFQQYLVCSE